MIVRSWLKCPFFMGLFLPSNWHSSSVAADDAADSCCWWEADEQPLLWGNLAGDGKLLPAALKLSESSYCSLNCTSFSLTHFWQYPFPWGVLLLLHIFLFKRKQFYGFQVFTFKSMWKEGDKVRGQIFKNATLLQNHEKINEAKCDY